MCYGIGCYYEDSHGECTKPRREICPERYAVPEEWSEDFAGILSEQERNALLESE